MRNSLLLKTLAVFTCFFILGTRPIQATNPTPETANLANTNKPGLLENRGQLVDTDGKPRPDLLFTAESKGVRVFITAKGLHYQFQKTETTPETTLRQAQGTGQSLVELVETSWHSQAQNGEARRRRPEPVEGGATTTLYRLDVSLVGANPNPTVRREEATGYYENYYLAHCPDGITGVKSYGRVVLENVYPNIDWVLYRAGEYLKYDFIVRPGGNPDLIKLKFDGATDLTLNADGSFTATTPLGSITEQAPISFQSENKTQVDSRFVLADNVLGFEAKGRNANETLTIDPSLVWGTYYGGSGIDYGTVVCLGKHNQVYLTGYTESVNAISSNNSHQSIYGGGPNDGFLSMFDTTGIRIWSTYYGGSGDDYFYGAIVDKEGHLIVSGYTSSQSAIATPISYQNNFGGGLFDVLLIKFDSTGARLWSTYFGGNGADYSSKVAVDSNGFIYLGIHTTSNSSIATIGSHQVNFGGGNYDSFLAKFNANGVLKWGTYYGGNNDEHSTTVLCDKRGFVYLGGWTKSNSMIATNGTHQSNFGGGTIWGDAFLVKFDSLGIRQWASYFGGSSDDYGSDISIDNKGNLYLVGYTSSNTNISTNNAHQAMYGGGDYDVLLAKFNGHGIINWATYLGGTNTDKGYSVVVDKTQQVIISGYSSSTTSISSNSAFQVQLAGSNDAFWAVFDTSGTRISGSYYGGAGDDQERGLAVSENGLIYICGWTASVNNFQTNSAFQATYGGGTFDAFLAKFDLSQITATEPEWTDAGTILAAYPNPTKQELTLRFSLPQYGNASISLLDLQGRSVLAQTLGTYPAGTHSYELDLVHLPAGLYLLKLDAAGASQTVRVVKE